MNWFKKHINKFKKKSPVQKAFDLIFIAFVVIMLFPNGRMAFQRIILKTGLMNPDLVNENRIAISDEAFREFVFLDEQGNQHELGEYKGQVIFLNFWATWCPPCRAELPSITNLYHKMEDTKGIKFLFLSYEEKPIVTTFAKDFGTDIPFSYLTYKTPEILNPPGLPTTFVIDKSGNIVSKTTGMANWDSEDFISQLQALIKE